MEVTGPVEVDVNVNFNYYKYSNDLVDKFLESVPKQGFHQEALRTLGVFYRKHTKHFGFEQSELDWIQEKCDIALLEVNNSNWKKVYEELSQAAYVLEAFKDRSRLSLIQSLKH